MNPNLKKQKKKLQKSFNEEDKKICDDVKSFYLNRQITNNFSQHVAKDIDLSIKVRNIFNDEENNEAVLRTIESNKEAAKDNMRVFDLTKKLEELSQNAEKVNERYQMEVKKKDERIKQLEKEIEYLSSQLEFEKDNRQKLIKKEEEINELKEKIKCNKSKELEERERQMKEINDTKKSFEIQIEEIMSSKRMEAEEREKQITEIKQNYETKLNEIQYLYNELKNKISEQEQLKEQIEKENIELRAFIDNADDIKNQEIEFLKCELLSQLEKQKEYEMKIQGKNEINKTDLQPKLIVQQEKRNELKNKKDANEKNLEANEDEKPRISPPIKENQEQLSNKEVDQKVNIENHRKDLLEQVKNKETEAIHDIIVVTNSEKDETKEQASDKVELEEEEEEFSNNETTTNNKERENKENQPKKEPHKSESLIQEAFSSLDQFEKIEKIGMGSFGKVFKVCDKQTGTFYAAKISYRLINDEDDSTLLNLTREVTIISKLNHPSVLRFIFFDKYNFKHEERPVIITEYAHNGSLEDFIGLNSQSHLDDTHKLIIIYGIASGMSYLHSYNIIHRDLKPSNILLDESLNPKIADFGLSKIEDQSYKSVSDLKGTPCYMSPEIFERYEYSKSSDVYAFGIILYELLTNEKVFNEKTSQQIIELLNSGYRPEFTSPIADSYKNLIEKCWSQDPSERPTFEDIVKKQKNRSRIHHQIC